VARRVLERRVTHHVDGSRGMLTLGFLFAIFPRVLAYPLSIVFFWITVTLLYKGYKLHRRKGGQETGETVEEEKR